MHGFRALLAALLIVVVVRTIAWYAVAALRQLVRVWPANGCSLDFVLSGAGLCY